MYWSTMTAFRNFDLIGGVDLSVERNFLHRNAQKSDRYSERPSALNGKSALEFVRFRNDALGDIGRERATGFVKAVLRRSSSSLCGHVF